MSNSYAGIFQGLLKTKVVAIDTETTGLNVLTGKDYLQGLSVAISIEGITFSEYFPIRHKTDNISNEDKDELFRLLKNVPTIYWHNRKFDLHSLMTLGVNASTWGNEQHDTMLLAHMINEEWPRQKSLEAVSQHYLKKGKSGKDDLKPFTDVIGWGEVSPAAMHDYACRDAELTLELGEKLLGIFYTKFKEDAKSLLTVEIQMNTVLFNMEQLGILVDQKFCRQYHAIATMEMEGIEAELGFKPSKTTDLSKFLFEDLKLPVLEVTATGRPKMDKAVMEEYDRMLANTDDPRARLVLNYRGWMKADSTFYLPFQSLADSNGAVHCNFNQHRTVTGRLSCDSPNLQQIPRTSDKEWNGKIRSAFKARPGFRLFGFDYSQLELRLATAYGQEEILIDEFSKPNADPFTRYSVIIAATRFMTKTFFYALMYGAGKEKTVKTLNKPMAEVGPMYDTFLRSIPGIIKAKKLAESRARSRGYVRYWSGRRRHFNNKDSAFKAFNALMQGGAAEIVKFVMILIFETVCDDNCRMLLQVHDEIVFEIREGMEDYYIIPIVEIMERFPTQKFGVPFKVAGKLWGKED